MLVTEIRNKLAKLLAHFSLAYEAVLGPPCNPDGPLPCEQTGEDTMNRRLHYSGMLVFLATFLLVDPSVANGLRPGLTAANSAQTLATRDDEPAIAEFRRWANAYVDSSLSIITRLSFFHSIEGVRLAKQRQSRMEELIRSDPERALTYSIPYAIRQRLPSDVVQLLEEPISGLGDLDVNIACNPAKRISQQIDRFVQINGKRYRAFAYGRRANQATKREILLHGIALGGVLALHEKCLEEVDSSEAAALGVQIIQLNSVPVKELGIPVFARIGTQIHRFASREQMARAEAELDAAEATTGPSLRVPVMGILNSEHWNRPVRVNPNTWTFGPKRVLVIRVDFPDIPGEPVSVTSASNLLNGDVNQFFVSSSYGNTSLVNTISSTVYRLPQPSTYYAPDRSLALHDDAEQLASNDYVLTDFDRIMVVFTGIGYWWAGYASIGGSRIWLNGWTDYPYIPCHELGHTYGLFHANLWQVSGPNPIGSGSTLEYGDAFDVMAGTSPPEADFNPWFKNTLGWIPESSVTNATTSGTYRVYRFDDPQVDFSHQLAMKIPRGNQKNYWIGFRRKFTENQFALSGAYVFWGYDVNRQSDLLDMTTPGVDASDAPLQIGVPFNDPVAGVNFTVIDRSGVSPNEYLDIDLHFTTPLPPEGPVLAWGDDRYGNIITPDNLSGVTTVAAGFFHSLALESTGKVVGWGFNGWGEASPPSDLTDATAIAAGLQFSVAAKRNGTVLAWGINNRSQLNVPSGLSGVISLAAGWYHCLALKSDGTVVGWGDNSSNQVAIPPSLTNVTAIAGGAFHSLALISDGTVVGWGQNNSGQAEPPAGLTGVVQIAAGGYYSLAVKANGTVVQWGAGYAIPANVIDVVSVAAHDDHAMALKTDRSVVAWGLNDYGECNVPVGLTGTIGIAAGYQFSLAVRQRAPTIAQQPADQTVYVGQDVELSVAAIGTPFPNFQWRKDGLTLPGATATTLVLHAVQQGDAGGYTVDVINDAGSVSSRTALLTVMLAPVKAVNISTRMRVETGNNVLIGGFIIVGNESKNVAVRGIGPSLVLVGISGFLIDPTLELRDASGALIAQNDDWQSDPSQAAQLIASGLALQGPKESGIVATLQPGSYTTILAGQNQTTGVGLVEIYDLNNAADSQLANISTRGFVQTGGDVMIGGFILGGSGNTHVVVRGIGPSLELNPVLADPTLELHNGNGVTLVANDDWADDPVSASQLTLLGLAPQNPMESGIYTSLPPGAFTAILAGKNSGTGIGLVEIYNVH